MKRWILALPLLLLFGAARAQEGLNVRVTNPESVARADEIVSLSWGALAPRVPGLAADRARVVEAGSEKEVPAQVVDADGDGTPDELLFLVSLWPDESRFYRVQARKAASFAARAHVRHQEIRDDAAWENDRVTYRTYGMGLQNVEPLISSGVDVWTKRVPGLVIDRWYAKDDYHRDRGEGADFYTVGTTLGAGGIGIWQDGALYPAPNFETYRILADGPIRAIIELEHGPWEAGGRVLTETRRIQIDAGRLIYRQESSFRAEDGNDLQVAVGLAKRPDVVYSAQADSVLPWMSLWGPVGSKFGGHGDLGTFVLLDTAAPISYFDDGAHRLAIYGTASGVPVHHFVGSAWTASGEVRSAEDFWREIEKEQARLESPVLVELGGTNSPR